MSKPVVLLEKGLPAQLDAEKCILGAILLNNSVIEQAANLLRPEDFYLKSNQLIFRTMQELGEKRQPIELVTIQSVMNGNLEKVGGSTYISSLIDGVTQANDVSHYANMVKEAAAKRKLINIANLISSKCLDNDNISDILNYADSALFEFKQSGIEFRPETAVRCLADIQAEKVQWLYHPYIPFGKLTIIEGDPGVGKSWITCAIATAVVGGKGLFGMEPTEPRYVLMLSAEDGLSDTIRPRLDRMNADVSRIFAIEGAMSFDKTGLLKLEAYLLEYKPSLVIIDPLVAYLGADVDIHRANETRVVMAALARIAEQCGCAIIAVRHLTKGGMAKAMYRGIGSIDLAAACRSVLLVGCDPDDSSQRAIVHIKSNLAEIGQSIGYTIKDGIFYWTGASDLTAIQILTASSDDSEGSARGEAERFLREVLADGPRLSKEVETEARQAGISERTLKRARKSLGVESHREGEAGKRGGGTWYLKLPDSEGQENIGGILNQNDASESAEHTKSEMFSGSDLECQDLEGQEWQDSFDPLNDSQQEE